ILFFLGSIQPIRSRRPKTTIPGKKQVDVQQQMFHVSREGPPIAPAIDSMISQTYSPAVCVTPQVPICSVLEYTYCPIILHSIHPTVLAKLDGVFSFPPLRSFSQLSSFIAD
ncbi:hypothetical protein J6590_094873, partial [Homalodisca vitripennis]